MRPPTETSYQERIREAVAYLESHLDESLSLDELARVACFSPFHFHRIFRGIVGESVAEHTRRLRLERAARRLRSGAPDILSLALDAGYEAPEAFTRAFQSRFGVSPSAYRRARRTPPAFQPEPATRATDLREEILPMEVRVMNLEPIRVAYIRHVGRFHGVGQTFGQLAGWAGPRGLLGPSSRWLAVWLDDPEVTAPEKIRGDACVTVREGVSAEGPVGIREIPGGEYAMFTHHGPYDRLTDTYARFCGEWLQHSGRELAEAPPFEDYRNNPQTAVPEDLLTDIYLPLKPI